MNQSSDITTADSYQETTFPAIEKEITRNNRSPAALSSPISFGGREVDGLNIQAFLALFLLMFVALVVLIGNDSYLPEMADLQHQTTAPVTVESGQELISLLKENGLWNIDGKTAVPPLILSSYPDNIDELETDEKKQVFLNTLLPAALVALAEVEREKQALHNILAKFPGGYHDLVFSKDFGVWGRVLSMDEIDFVLLLTRKYRTKRARQLVKRVDVIPLSLLLAQAAIESSWGSSRFAREGNNLFGIWTWGEKGIIPNGRDDGKTHKVAMYDSILDSIRAYIITLNRLPHYNHFREIRRQSRNPLKLAEGLLNYSERRDTYVWELQNFIESNDLHKYDDCFLTDSPSFSSLLKTVGLKAPVPGGKV